MLRAMSISASRWLISLALLAMCIRAGGADAAPSRGEALAQRWCSECHAVEPGVAIAKPEGAGFSGDRRRTLGDRLLAPHLFADDTYDDAEFQNQSRRYRRSRRLHSLLEAEAIGCDASAQLTETRAKTSLRSRLQKERFHPSDKWEGGWPASFARRLVLRRERGKRSCLTV
jgi:hypothetical protein